MQCEFPALPVVAFPYALSRHPSGCSRHLWRTGRCVVPAALV